MTNRTLTWTFSGSSQKSRLSQIASIARAEAIGSTGLYLHVGLIAVASFAGLMLYGLWQLSTLMFVYIAVLVAEKLVAKSAMNTSNTLLYWPLLALLFMRGMLYNVIVLWVWTMDGDVFKFAAGALVVAATINIFVFHATHFEIIGAMITPIWLCCFGIVGLSFLEHGLAQEPFVLLLVLACVTPYFLMALKSVLDRWTEQDLIRQSLNHTQKIDALGQLVAGVAHDFNNILTVTRGNAELISGTAGVRNEELIDEIIRASERGSALSGQLLAFGRRSNLMPQVVYIDEFLDANYTLLRRVLPENIDLTYEAIPNLPAIFVDRNQLETAIVNLTINARDAMEAGGSLVIEADRMVLRGQGVGQLGTPLTSGEYVMISVSDTGHGIPDDLMEQIFDPFFTTKPEGKGSGLGLSMVIGFAEQSLGGVKLDSKQGVGTRVSLFLPAHDPGAENDP